MGYEYPLSFEWKPERDETDEERRERLAEEYNNIQARLSQDKIPKSVDAVFIPGLAEDVLRAYDLFKHAAQLVNSGQAKCIIYNDLDWRGLENAEGKAYKEGAEWYKEALMAEGVTEDKLIAAGQKGFHTRAQTDELVDVCKERGFTSVVMASVTYHNARVMSAAVASMSEREYGMNLYCLNAGYADGVNPDTYEVTMSQGKGKQSLTSEIAADRGRGIDYMDRGSPANNPYRWMTPNGHGAPADVLERYLKLRDSGKLPLKGDQEFTRKIAGW